MATGQRDVLMVLVISTISNCWAQNVTPPPSGGGVPPSIVMQRPAEPAWLKGKDKVTVSGAVYSIGNGFIDITNVVMVPVYTDASFNVHGGLVPGHYAGQAPQLVTYRLRNYPDWQGVKKGDVIFTADTYLISEAAGMKSVTYWKAGTAPRPAPRPSTPAPTGVPTDVYSGIVHEAEHEWPGNYQMQEYVIRQQVEAYRRLHP
jgi:hypothetical protein